ncbi:hypothetical protein P154DRAFT_570186 [Amniculicola lignicola CBS 123094]|uniref:Uncharacterized protein n=1 Tax=Amniculicola lignicola CBS 123094 TaxID=1392246 RepID=A0A6A5WWL4_9PLEO|nr:hypothetical protein P154DRAFT_570186 [Amniculicola lignicola CBS 123094]
MAESNIRIPSHDPHDSSPDSDCFYSPMAVSAYDPLSHVGDSFSDTRSSSVNSTGTQIHHNISRLGTFGMDAGSNTHTLNLPPSTDFATSPTRERITKERSRAVSSESQLTITPSRVLTNPISTPGSTGTQIRHRTLRDFSDEISVLGGIMVGTMDGGESDERLQKGFLSGDYVTILNPPPEPEVEQAKKRRAFWNVLCCT